MLVLVLTIPLMVVGLLVALGPLAMALAHDHKRRRAGELESVAVLDAPTIRPNPAAVAELDERSDTPVGLLETIPELADVVIPEPAQV